MLADDSITDVDISTDEIVVKQKVRAHLLGFIPITVPATASRKAMGRMKTSDVTLERSGGPEVEVDYPWYGFLLKKKSSSEKITSDTLEIDTNYEASFKTTAKFKAGKALAETVK